MKRTHRVLAVSPVLGVAAFLLLAVMVPQVSPRRGDGGGIGPRRRDELGSHVRDPQARQQVQAFKERWGWELGAAARPIAPRPYRASRIRRISRLMASNRASGCSNRE